MTATALIEEFNRYFTSMNGVDVPQRVSVPRDEWRALHAAIKQTLAAQTEPDIAYSIDSDLIGIRKRAA